MRRFGSLDSFIILVTCLGAIGLISVDIVLPALPQLALSFNCSEAAIQDTMSAAFLGLALCQLLYGLLADYFGKKRMLLVGMALFTISSLLCSSAKTENQFLIYRVMQTMASGVGTVLSRSMVVERYSKTEAVRILAILFMVIGLSPAIAPLLGGYLMHYFCWQAIFFFVAFLGAIVFFMILWSYRAQDIKQHSPQASPPHTSTFRESFYVPFLNLNFWACALVICAGYTAFRCYTTQSPFIFRTQGYAENQVGVFYAALALSYILGNLTVKSLIRKMASQPLIYFGLLLFLVGSPAMVLSSIRYTASPWAITLPMCMVTFGNGMLFPLCSANALMALPPSRSGLGSGLLGATKLLCAAFFIHGIGHFYLTIPNILSWSIFAVTVLGTLSYTVLSRLAVRIAHSAPREMARINIMQLAIKQERG